MRIANENLLTTAVALTADRQLRALWLGHICNYAIQIVFTGTPTGTFSLQGSNDPGTPDGGLSPQATNVTNWTDIAGSAQAVTTAGNHMWDVQNAGYTWVRVIYVFGSSTGSLTVARANVKGV